MRRWLPAKSDLLIRKKRLNITKSELLHKIYINHNMEEVATAYYQYFRHYGPLCTDPMNYDTLNNIVRKALEEGYYEGIWFILHKEPQCMVPHLEETLDDAKEAIDEISQQMADGDDDPRWNDLDLDYWLGLHGNTLYILKQFYGSQVSAFDERFIPSRRQYHTVNRGVMQYLLPRGEED